MPSLHDFFTAVLPKQDGWTPVLTKDPFGNLTQFRWFCFPRDLNDMVNYCVAKSGEDCFFSPFLYRRPPTESASNWARKENLLAAAVVWSDGDDCPIGDLRVRPSVVVQSSPDHWQAYWRLADTGSERSVFDYEAWARGLYLQHKDAGMDSGWHLAKKMRVPGTLNCKDKYGEPFRVTWTPTEYNATVAEFEAEYPAAPAHADSPSKPVPGQRDEDYPYQLLGELNDGLINDLFSTEPRSNWSADMYYLQCLLWEARMSLEDSFYVMREAACNKFARDGRPDGDLWTQMNRDYARWQETVASEVIDSLDDEALESLLQEQGKTLKANAQGLFWHDLDFLYAGEEASNGTFVDIFTTWAQTRSQQSPRVFNEMGAVMVMASTMAKFAKIPLSFGDLGLNVFMLVLGQTTQSRKTTSLSMGRQLLRELTSEAGPQDPEDPESAAPEYLSPEDATPEALSAWMSERPHQSCTFARDEVQDMFGFANEASSYMRNMVPFLTKIYDGVVPGMLRRGGDKTNVPATPHYASFYGTGIFNQAARGLTRAKIESGFVPRCLVVTDTRTEFTPGADDVFLRKGMAAKVDQRVYALLMTRLRRAIKYWGNKALAAAPQMDEVDAALGLIASDLRVELDFTPEAFERWQRFAYDVTRLAADHPVVSKELFPMCERMSYSVLKVAGLLSMLDCADTVTTQHVVKAISLAAAWAQCAEQLVSEVCNNGLAADIKAIETWLESQPQKAATMSKLLLKFQGRWDSLRQAQDVLAYARARGTIKETIRGKRQEDRVLHYVG